jgi:hypothetical protein
MVLSCVMSVVQCCLVVVPLSRDKIPFALRINNNNNNSQRKSSRCLMLLLCLNRSGDTAARTLQKAEVVRCFTMDHVTAPKLVLRWSLQPVIATNCRRLETSAWLVTTCCCTHGNVETGLGRGGGGTTNTDTNGIVVR